jgi:hypothetical protein
MTAATIPQLGRLKSVDLRSVWPSEPHSFDPWLCQPENLQFLAESLGLPGLELVHTQHPVGPFFADIVARIIGTDHLVLIENQLDQADHRHLGQVLTYAPHLDARICVWVARDIRDEHRAAIDWLNRITAEGYAFFAVEVRAVQIGDSMPAPLFDVVARPNEWARMLTSSTAAGEPLSHQAQDNIEYWEKLHQLIVDGGGPTRQVSKPLKDVTYWAPVASGGRAYIWAFRSTGKKPYVSAGISFYNAGAAQVWEKLHAREEEFNGRFGEVLRWHTNKARTAFHIQCASRPGSLEPQDWPSQHQWLAERMVRFDQAFGDAVKHLFLDFDEGERGPENVGTN